MRRRAKRVGPFVRDFPWIHLGIGLVGNLAFVVGSVMFFYSGLATAAIWVFVVASAGMFVGSIGELAVRIQTRRDVPGSGVRKAPVGEPVNREGSRAEPRAAA